MVSELRSLFWLGGMKCFPGKGHRICTLQEVVYRVLAAV